MLLGEQKNDPTYGVLNYMNTYHLNMKSGSSVLTSELVNLTARQDHQRLRFSPLRVRKVVWMARLFATTYAHFTEALRNPSRYLMKAGPKYSSEVLFQPLSTSSLKLLRPPRVSSICS